jgi:hypothetical protein
MVLAHTSGTTPMWRLAFDTSGLLSFSLAISGASKPIPTSDFPWSNGDWHHVTLMVDRGGLARMYADGRLLGEGSIAAQLGRVNADSFALAGWGQFLTGSIDEFYLFQGTHGPELARRLMGLATDL